MNRISYLTNARNLALLLFAIANAYSAPPDSIPIAEYCVVYEKKMFCDCETDSYVFANVYLRLEKVLEEQNDIALCTTISQDFDFYWIRKFLIHDDLKAKPSRVGFNIGYPGALHAKKYIYTPTIAEWDFASEVPIYAKDTNWVDSSKYGKYYKKGKIIPVEWQLKAKCHPYYEAAFSGSYFIRITGECPKH